MVVKFHHVPLDKIILNSVLGEGVNNTWTAVMTSSGCLGPSAEGWILGIYNACEIESVFFNSIFKLKLLERRGLAFSLPTSFYMCPAHCSVNRALILPLQSVMWTPVISLCHLQTCVSIGVIWIPAFNYSGCPFLLTGDQRSLSPSAWHRSAADGCDWYLHSMFVLCLFLNVCPMGRFPRFSNGLYLQTCSEGRRYFKETLASTNPYNKALLVCACAAWQICIWLHWWLFRCRVQFSRSYCSWVCLDCRHLPTQCPVAFSWANTPLIVCILLFVTVFLL